MLERRFHAGWAIDELAAQGLIVQRGWADGPGAVWVPSAAGEALYQQMILEDEEAVVQRSSH